jgi:hypothetical protein
MAFGMKDRSPVQGRRIGSRLTGEDARNALAEAEHQKNQRAISGLQYIQRNGGDWVSIEDDAAIRRDVAAAKQVLRDLGYKL